MILDTRLSRSIVITLSVFGWVEYFVRSIIIIIIIIISNSSSSY